MMIHQPCRQAVSRDVGQYVLARTPQIHLTKEPLVEEYSVAAQVWGSHPSLHAVVLRCMHSGRCRVATSKSVCRACLHAQLERQAAPGGSLLSAGSGGLRGAVERWHAQVWKMTATDLCEIARNSVLHSGFPHQAPPPLRPLLHPLPAGRPCHINAGARAGHRKRSIMQMANASSCGMCRPQQMGRGVRARASAGGSLPARQGQGQGQG